MDGQFTITVGHGNADLVGSTNETIQAAVDRVAAVGRGMVHILPGTYVMHDSLHLRSGVSVRGEGDATVLWKPPGTTSPLTKYLGYGHFDVTVAHPERFKVGMGIRVSDDDSCGFYNTVATIVGRNGSEFVIDRMLVHDYQPTRNGKVSSLYPIVSGYHIEDVVVSDIAIDGNASENEFIDGCRGGGIFLLQNRNVTIRNVTVRNYNGDGISFQQGMNTTVEGCRILDNKGTALHPGSGSVGIVMRNDVCRGNGEYGIFYCLRVSYALCEGCTIEGNGRDGISIGYRDNDGIIRNNVISGNGRHAIYFREDHLNDSGNRTLISRNVLDSNCRKQGAAEVFIDSVVEDIHLLDNRFATGSNANCAVFLNAKPNGLVLHGNSGLNPLDVAAANEGYLQGVSFDIPSKQLEAGPEHAGIGSCHHLGLRTWL